MRPVCIRIRPPKVHWRLYFTRKVLFMGILMIATSILEAYVKFPLTSRAHELTMAAMFEHLFFGIPFHD